MNELLTKKCVPCEKGAPRLTPDQLDAMRPQIPDWEIRDTDGVQKLHKVFKFKNFAQALAFTNSVGELAEAEYHHPTIVLDWGRVEVIWTTHKIKGLHENDVVMAARTDALI